MRKICGVLPLLINLTNLTRDLPTLSNSEGRIFLRQDCFFLWQDFSAGDFAEQVDDRYRRRCRKKHEGRTIIAVQPSCFIDNYKWSRYFINRIIGLVARPLSCAVAALSKPLFVSAPLCPLLLVVSGANAADRLSVLESSLVRYGQFFATFCATCCQNLAAVGGSHSCAESVLVDSLAARWLECSLHCHNYLVFIVSAIFTVRTTPADWVLCGVQRYNLFLILQSICRNFSRF